MSDPTDIKAIDEAADAVRVSPKLVLDCLSMHEFGDSVHYSTVNLGRVLYNQTTGEWLSFDGVRFKRDLAGEALRLVELVALEYEQQKNEFHRLAQEATRQGESDRARVLEVRRDQFARAARRLRSHRGIQNCLALARLHAHHDAAEHLDQPPVGVIRETLVLSQLS